MHTNFRNSKSAMLLSFWTHNLDHYARSLVGVREFRAYHAGSAMEQYLHLPLKHILVSPIVNV